MKIIFNKSKIPALMFAWVMLTSCISSQSFMPVKGSGMSKERTFNVTDFHGIEVSNGFDVILVQGSSEGLILTAQENLFEHIVVKVDQGILKIYAEENIMATQPMKARITFKNIGTLKVSGGGDVTCETKVEVPALEIDLSGGGDLSTELNTGELKCRISGGGDASIKGSVRQYNLDLSGGGDIHTDVITSLVSFQMSGGGDIDFIGRDKTSDATFTTNGGGDMTLTISAEKLNCSLSGGGDVRMNGQAKDVEININGGGDVDAAIFNAGNVTFRASGGSDIHLNATGSITGNISGGGDVYYKGTPARIDIDTHGGSEIHRE